MTLLKYVIVKINIKNSKKRKSYKLSNKGVNYAQRHGSVHGQPETNSQDPLNTTRFL